MADLTRSARSRRGGRRPSWALLTVLLVLAIGASSALVFTNRVELLKLAVILALWAAVVAAFVSVIYRRQSDSDQAKVRDLKLVYDLQLDREISARREYELTVETELRRELASEIRAQAADEVAGLRAELAALRANLEILFDADLSHRPAIENERTTVRAYSDWARDAETTGRVSSSRIDTEDRYGADERTDESPIIDVPAEPHPPEPEWVTSATFGGAHRRPSEMEQEGRRREDEPPRAWTPPPAPAPPEPAPQQAPEPEFPWLPPQQEQPPKPPEPPPQAPRPEPEPVAAQTPPTAWQPAPAEGQWTPAGTPGSNWASAAAPDSSAQPTADNGSSAEYVGRRRAAEPAMSPPPPSVRGRHSAPPEATDPGRRPTPPTLATESAQPPPQPQPTPPAPAPPTPVQPRHRSAEDTGGQSVAELLARLQATPTGGGRRRRRDE